MMNKSLWRVIPVVAALAALFCYAQDVAPQIAGGPDMQIEAAESQPVRFAAVDVFLDSGDIPLAAYQFELSAKTGEFLIVGIEGGEHRAFTEPPYYDPAALSRDRVIIAAFNTGDPLPTGKTRVARIHVRLVAEDDPEYVVNLTVAASPEGEPIEADVSIVKGE